MNEREEKQFAFRRMDKPARGSFSFSLFFLSAEIHSERFFFVSNEMRACIKFLEASASESRHSFA